MLLQVVAEISTAWSLLRGMAFVPQVILRQVARTKTASKMPKKVGMREWKLAKVVGSCCLGGRMDGP